MESQKYYLAALKGENNYEIWALKMQALLSKNALNNYIADANCGYEAMEEDGSKPGLTDECRKAASTIILHLADGPLLMVKHHEHPAAIWEALRELYSPKGFSSEFLLCKELFNTTLQGNKHRMEEYLNTVKKLYDQPRAKDIAISEKVTFAWVLNNLTPEYETLITAITQSIRVNGMNSVNLAELFSNLIDESKRLKNRDATKERVMVTAGQFRVPKKTFQVTKNTATCAPIYINSRVAFLEPGTSPRDH